MIKLALCTFFDAPISEVSRIVFEFGEERWTYASAKVDILPEPCGADEMVTNVIPAHFTTDEESRIHIDFSPYGPTPSAFRSNVPLDMKSHMHLNMHYKKDFTEATVVGWLR